MILIYNLIFVKISNQEEYNRRDGKNRRTYERLIATTSEETFHM
jgi:hypothetical protein